MVMASASFKGEIMKENFVIVATLLLLFVRPLNASTSNFELTPTVEVTLFNSLQHDVLYMCSFKECGNSMQIIKSETRITWKFTQIAFPLHWIYIYINGKMNGFFWAYSVRLGCNKCFWRIEKFPFLYRSDRNRWERQLLYPPPYNYKAFKTTFGKTKSGSTQK